MPRPRWADTSYAPRCSVLGRDDRRAEGPVPGDPERPARPGAARGAARQRRRRPGRPVQRDALRAARRARAARARRGHQVPHRAGAPDQGDGDPGGGAGLGQRVRACLARADRARGRAHRRGDRGAARRRRSRLRRQAGAGRLLGGAGAHRPGPESADLDDEQYDTAVAVLGERALVELSTLVGYYATLALQMRIFRVPAPAPDAAATSASHAARMPRWCRFCSRC